ncbi:uncharacterized protein ACWYII_031911 isoform 2-T2 [Salvelinus alpinus]
MNKDRLLGAVSPAPSQLSLKSDHSMDRPITFTNGDLRLLGAVSPAPSQLSLKSDHSMDRPITFTNGDLSVKQERVWSPCLSMKNDCSMDRPITFGKDASGKQERVWSPCLSMKSDCSMDRPITFGKDASGKQERVWSPCLSMKSDWSMDRPITFGKVASELTASLLTEDHFRCSVCTEVLKEPVSIPCGHSYCRQCIETYWNQPDQTGDYDCPQCSKRFRTRPDLLTNSALEKVIEKLHQAGFKVPALPKHCYAGPGDVACDLCSEKQLKAVKSCLTCTASYCESHVRQHYTVAALQRHTLVEVTGNLEQKLCQLHHRALEVFCKTDQVSVCLLCALQDHRNHDVIKNERDTEEAKTTNQGQQAAWRSETKLQRDVQQKKTELTNIIQPEQTLEKATWELTYHTKHFYRGFEAVPTKDWTADSVVVAALGRPLDLGMLYDCRSDSFCSDVCLWNNATIASMQLSLPRTHTEVKCLEGDSLQDRFRALDVTTPLRASVLSGLVEVGGAAGYLKHPVQSTLQDRVTLQYRTTTRLDMLSHSVLQEETDRTQRKATHVVMAVLYGAQAFFIFDSKHINRQRNASREKTKMLDVIKKMLNTFNSEDIFSSLTDSEKVNSLLYQCTLHSDVDSTTTMDYDTAVEVYQSLPKRLGQRGEKAVPVRVWLYPLKNLDHAAACVAFEISEDLLLRAENVLEHLRRVTMRCQDMMSDHTNAYVMKWFPYAKDKLTQFSQSLSEYQVAFQKVLGKATEFIRENGESGLLWFREILKKHDQSPFTPQALDHWLHNKEAEVNAVNICKTKNLPIVKSEKELETVLLDSQTDRVLCFTLTSLEDEDPFLATLKQHTHSVQENTVNQSDLTGQQETQRPFKPPDLTQKILSDLSLFTKSYEDSGDGENIKFIAAVIPDISVPGSSIRLYQQGSLITTNFQLGLKPDPVQVTEIKQSCVLLKFPQSTIRRPERYRVEYRVMTTGVSKVSKWPWNVVDTLAPAETCVVPGLKPFTLYQIRYSVIEHSGMSDFSKVIEVKTLRSPPVQLFVNRLDKETVKVTWLQPECDDGASVLHYKVDYKEAGLEGWSTMVTEGPECKCIITLNLSTCYRVRVSAVYGEGDTSEPSRETDVPVYVWFIDLSERKASLLLEVLKLQPEKKPVELKGWSDEESEVRSFLQCLSYISQLRLFVNYGEEDIWWLVLSKLSVAAAEFDTETGENILKTLSSMCRYTYGDDDDDGDDPFRESHFLLDLYSNVKDYETQTGRCVLPALQPVYQSAPAVWSIDLSETKASLLLEVLKLQPEKKPVELKGWSDEESEVRSFLQCLSYISQLSCDDDRFFQTVCESIPVRSREEDQQLASLLQFLGSTLSLGGELPRKTCRSVGRVLGLCASRVDLTLTPSKISLKGAALLLRHESKLHKLRLSVGMAVKLSRLVRRTGRGSTPLTVPELSLVLKSSQPPERVLSRALSSVASLLRLWRVQCLDLTDFWIQGHSLIALLCHQGPLSLRLNTDTLQQLTVVVYEAQDKDLTQWFLEKVGGDLTSCRLDWEVLLSLLQHSTHNITVDLRKNRLLEKNISDLLPFLGRVTLKRSSSSFVKSSIRHIYDSRDSDCVSSLLRSSDHWINLNSRELDRVDCTALCFTLQHSHQVKVNLLWTSIPPGEIESILPLLDRVSQLSVDRKLLLSFLQCCAASQVQVGAPSPPIAVWLLRSLHYRLDFSCSSSVDLSAQDPGEALCLTTDHCRAINSVLKQNQHSTQLVQNQVQLILRDCEVEDRALRELLPILHIVKLSPSKALLLQLLDLVCEGIEEGLLRHTESLWRALDGELDLSETRLDQKACGSLALVLEHSEGLSELDLSHCQLTDHHLQALITHLHKVQVLDLSHNDITDALTDRINTHRTVRVCVTVSRACVCEIIWVCLLLGATVGGWRCVV